jgi:hypothetical protein
VIWDYGPASLAEIAWTLMGVVVLVYLGRQLHRRWRLWQVLCSGAIASELDCLTVMQRLIIFVYLVSQQVGFVAIGLIAIGTPRRVVPAPDLEIASTVVFLVLQALAVALSIYLDRVERRTTRLIHELQVASMRNPEQGRAQQ